MNDLLKLQCENCHGPLELRLDNYGALLAGCKHCDIDYLVEKPRVNETHYPIRAMDLALGFSACAYIPSFSYEDMRILKYYAR